MVPVQLVFGFQTCPVHHVLVFHILTHHMMQTFCVCLVHLALVFHMSGSKLDFDVVVVTVNWVVICRVLPVHLVSISQIPCPPGEGFSHVSCPASVGCSYFTNPACVGFCNYSCPPRINFQIRSENHVMVSYINPCHMVLVFRIVHVHNVLEFYLLAVNMLFTVHMLHVHLELAFHIVMFSAWC